MKRKNKCQMDYCKNNRHNVIIYESRIVIAPISWLCISIYAVAVLCNYCVIVVLLLILTYNYERNYI